MSDDIVTQLRGLERWNNRLGFKVEAKLHHDAADEIERLRAALRRVVAGKWCVTEIQEMLGDLNEKAAGGGDEC